MSVNSDIIRLLNNGDAFDEKFILKRERELRNLYRKSLKNIRFQLSELYRKYGDNVEYEDLLVYKRLTNLEQSIIKELKGLTRSSFTSIENSIQSGFERSYTYTAFASEYALQSKMGFGTLNISAVEAALFNPLDRITWKERNVDNVKLMTKQIRQEITAGLIEGRGYYKTAKAITERMDVGVNKARLIVRTETHRVQSLGRNNAMQKTFSYAEDLGMDARKYWNATLDGETRKNHGRMEEVKPNEDDLFPFITMKGSTVLVEGPGLTGTTDDINCRCTLSMRFDDIPPQVRRDNISKKIIPYKTYDEWMKNRYIKAA